MSEKQFYLLQVNDALFPIGGYSHSQGLETYIQRGIVHNVDTAREYITHKIKWNLAYTELLAARLAYEAAEKKDLQELLYLEELLEASRIPMEQREAARKMGSRFAKTIEKLGLSISETGIFREYLDARKGKAVNHCCIYGVFCAEMQIPLEEALTHYLYAQTSAIVTNCVKTIPLSQTSGQQLLSGCYGEFDEILKDADIFNQSENIRKWYDGYHFGDVDVYCPWDVMNYVLDLQRKPDAKPLSYWKNTSDNAIIRSFIDYAGSSITQKLETLLSGGYIVQQVDENLTYDYLHSSEENLWSILYLTGYLTSVRADELENPLPERFTALTIPNEEIREIYETTVIRWFDESAPKWNRSALFDAVWSGNISKLQDELNRLLRRTISYHDYKEDFYHAFLAGIFAGAGYMVESNKEYGAGRSDVVVKDQINGRVAVFEAKYTRQLEKLECKCDEALKQIENQMYAKQLEEDYDEVLCYGISFFKKRCMVKK